MKKYFCLLVMLVCSALCFSREKKGYMADDGKSGGEIAVFTQDDLNIVSYVFVMGTDRRYFDEAGMVQSYYVVFDSPEEAKKHYKYMTGKIRDFQDFFNLWLYKLSDDRYHVEEAHQENKEDGILYTTDIMNTSYFW